MTKHGWYSKKYEKQNGSVYYSNTDGEKVLVTMVTDKKQSLSGFEDEIYVGEVVKYVEYGMESEGKKRHNIKYNK